MKRDRSPIGGPVPWSVRVRDQLLRRSVVLGNATDREVNRILAFLDRELFPVLESKLASRLAKMESAEGGIAPTAIQTDRYREMIRELDEAIAASTTKLGEQWSRQLRSLGQREGIRTAKILSETMPRGINIGVNLPHVNTLRAIATARPMQGRFLKDWVKDWTTATRRTVQTQINVGIAAGESTKQITRRVVGAADKAGQYIGSTPKEIKRNAETIARTSANHVTNKAREYTYDANQDIIQAYQWSSTLDARTSEICASFDGQTWLVGKAHPSPPAHPRCRSLLLPITKGIKELSGGKLKGYPEEAVRAADGKTPNRISYGDWLKGQPRSVQNKVLGPGKAEIFRAGRVPISKFIDARGKPRTLAELTKLDAKYAKRGASSPRDRVKTNPSAPRRTDAAVAAGRA